MGPTMRNYLVTPDMNAPIIPGRSAAGFNLNTHIDTIFEDKTKIPLWDESKGNLPDVILRTDDWLRYSPKLSNPLRPATDDQYYFNRGALQLIFDNEGILKSITLSGGYHGRIFNQISIGTKLAEVSKFFAIEYDPNDEVHYPTDEESHSGIEFYAEERSLDEAPEQVIGAIFVSST